MREGNLNTTNSAGDTQGQDTSLHRPNFVGATDRFFFVHLQKTAGTTLIHRLPRCFHRSEIYPDASDGAIEQAVISVDHLRDRWRVRRGEIRIVTGHFPLCTTELLGGTFTTLTALRDPVERTLSYLRHHREVIHADSGKPLEAIYEDPFRFHGFIHNHMVKMLSLTTTEMVDGALTYVELNGSALKRAMENLERMDVVGLQEHFGEFWEELRHRFGWHLGDLVRSNQTEPVPVAQAFRRRIARDNALDLELYQYARELHAHLAKRREHIPIA